MSENMRVTLILPKGLWDNIKRLVPAGQRSRLVAEALETEFRRRTRLEKVAQLERFQAYMIKKYGELPSSADEIAEMRQERDHELEGLR